MFGLGQQKRNGIDKDNHFSSFQHEEEELFVVVVLKFNLRNLLWNMEFY